jgi:hypothetical protein
MENCKKIICYEELIKKIAEILHKRGELTSRAICSEEIVDKKLVEELKEVWKPWEDLSEEFKEPYMQDAEKIIDLVPNKCPLDQCGGLMEVKEGEEKDSMRYLKCLNCGALFKFQDFKKEEDTTSK